MAEAYPSTSSEPTAEESAKNRIVKAEEYKQAGNILYKEKSYKMAIGKYHRALLQVRDIDNQRPKPLLKGLMGLAGEGNNVFKQDKNLTNEMTQQVKQLELSCYNNLAGRVYILSFQNFWLLTCQRDILIAKVHWLAKVLFLNFPASIGQ